MPRNKNHCFTLNNYTDQDIEDIEKFHTNYCQYMTYSKEVGESGTPHLQGWFILKRESSMKSIKSVGLFKAHLEVMRGSPLENEDYINKQNTATVLGSQNIIVPNLEAVMVTLLPYIEKMKKFIISDSPENLKKKLEEVKKSILYDIAIDYPIQYIRHRTGFIHFINERLSEGTVYYAEREYFYCY